MPGADVPQEQKAGWASFIKSLASMTGDLSSMTAPPFILSPTSLTEFPAYWCEHPDHFAEISEGKDDKERMERVLKWFIGTLSAQYTTRNEKMGSEKKPLNPVLGELFYGIWPDSGRGETRLIVEQVSHHPPITAYYIENKQAGVRLQGHSGQKTSFTGTAINVKQSGHAVLTVQPKNGQKEEKYLITLPKLRIEGIVWGSPYIELTDTNAIQSSTGLTAQIDYKGKGYFTGKSHSFKAVISNASGKSVQNYEGVWTGKSHIGGSKGPLFLDTTGPKEEVTVRDVTEQTEWESRKLWVNVAKGIRTGNYDEAGKDKNRIENEQRQRRKDETAANTTWEHLHFSHVDSDSDYQFLSALLHDKLTPPHEDAYVIKPETLNVVGRPN
ncbi:uncharacterized protein I303_101472 [Kwoniella dejecticola CBS 10117]|uniref:Oxysterol binding protein n=1 Tax=Kwoniella dejecticola CBS 10117 TaxID=1296121 RepID=A0AAJ8MFA2_9TREE